MPRAPCHEQLTQIGTADDAAAVKIGIAGGLRLRDGG
jgi:hypothetical protein